MASDTYSSDGIGVLLMGTGNDNNVWGANANVSDFQVLSDAICSALSSAVTGGTLDLSGTPPPAAASQVHYGFLVFTGLLGSDQGVIVPNFRKWWLVQNATSGAHSLIMRTPSGGSSNGIPQNSGWQLVICDGNNNVVASPFNFQQIQMPDGTAGAPAYSTYLENNSGIYRAGANDFRFSIGGTDVLKWGPGTIDVVGGTLKVGGVTIDVTPVPSGGVIPYAGTSAPTGWLLADGSAVSRTGANAALFAAIGTTFGAGDGVTTFNTPDLRGRVVAGKDNMGGGTAGRLTSTYFGGTATNLGAVGGSESHALITAELAAHTHTGSGTSSTDGAHTHSVTAINNTAGSGVTGGSGFVQSSQTTSSAGSHNHTLSFTSDSTGSGTAHNIVQPTIILNYLIKL